MPKQPSPVAAKILVTTSAGEGAREYVAALHEAGADAVLVDSRSGGASLAGMNGLLVTGGVDVDPSLSGADPLVTQEFEPERDALESALLRDARERKLPTLCICRGMQIANVAFGGTLLGDIAAELGDLGQAHRVADGSGRAERGLITAHVVLLEPGSLLARTVDTLVLPTGARHHQAVARVADDLLVAGRTRDGVIEALEARFASPFWLAVQWHPESTLALDGGASRRIFGAFTAAAREICAAHRVARHGARYRC